MNYLKKIQDASAKTEKSITDLTYIHHIIYYMYYRFYILLTDLFTLVIVSLNILMRT